MVFIIQNHILLISKLYTYKSRKNNFLINTCLLKDISKIKNIDEKVHLRNIAYKRKWEIIEDKLP